MSSQVRLLLLSGTGGDGVTSASSATVAALEDEGLRAALVDARRPSADGDDLLPEFGWLLGLDEERPAPWWGGLSTLAHVATWRRIRRALQRDDVHAVVVDAGDVDSAIALMDLPGTASRIASAALTPDRAMGSDPQDDGSPFARLAAARDEWADTAQLLASDATSVRLVCEPSSHSVDRVVRAAGIMAMLGVDVDGITINHCVRKSDDDGSLRAAQDSLVLSVQSAAGGPQVWKSTSRVRAVPKGRSAMGPLGRSAVLRDDTFIVESDDEGFDLFLPLAPVVAANADVGRFEDHLVVAFGGSYRWLELPSVLRRCLPLEAVRVTSGLRVRFAPDPALWRVDGAGAA